VLPGAIGPVSAVSGPAACLAVLQATLDGLPAPLAILDARGVVVSTNAAWKRAELDNGAWEDSGSERHSYLEVCAGADGPDHDHLDEVTRGLEQVLAGALAHFVLPYVVRNSVAERPFRLVLTPVAQPVGGALALHEHCGRDTQTLPGPTDGGSLHLQYADQAPAVMWAADVQLTVGWINQAGRAFTGATPGSCPEWDELIHPDDRPHCSVQLRDFAVSREPTVRRYRLARQDGVYRWVEERITGMRHPDGTFAGLIACCSDITDAIDGEAAIQDRCLQLERELRFADTLLGMSQAVTGSDNRDHLLDSMASILGRALEVDRCLIFDVRLPKRQAIALCEWLNPACPRATSIRRDYPLELFPESLRYLWEMRSPLESHRDQPNARLASEGSAPLLHEGMDINSLLWHPIVFSSDGFFLLVFNQVSHRRAWKGEERRFLDSMANLVSIGLQKIGIASELRERGKRVRLAERLEAMARVSGGVAREVGSLLASISSEAQALADQQLLSGPVDAHALELLKTIDRARLISSQLHAFSRPPPRNPQLVEIGALIAGLTAWMAGWRDDRIAVASIQPPQPIYVRADGNQLTVALMNLATNAREAMPQGGALAITTSLLALDQASAQSHGVPAGAYVAIRVSDTGHGMPPGAIERACEPFFTTKQRGQGYGLGLSSTHGLVHSYGGLIAIDSQPGQGTTVTISLPTVAVSSDKATVTPLCLQALGGDETVLLVEDDPAVLGLVRDALRHQGYSVLTATGGAEALAVAQAHRGHIDLLLTDVVLPQISGPSLACQLLISRQDLRIMLMSGYPADAFTAKREIAQAAFLAKPFTIDELIRTVRSSLSRDASAPP